MLGSQASAISLLLLVTSSAPVWADDISGLIHEGTDDVLACASCHGENGEGSADMLAPRIAGLDAEYIATALRGFADGSRPGDTMAGVAPALSSAQITGLAAHFAAAPVTRTEWPQPEEGAAPDLALGERIFRNGDWSHGVPGCVSCHGQNGEGVGAAFPRIANQLPEYMASRFAQLAEGGASANGALMAAVARNLPEAEQAAVIAYVATLDPAAGPVTSVPKADLAWQVPVFKDAPLSDAIDWSSAEKAYAGQQKRLADPALYTHVPPTPDQIPEGPEGEMIRFGRDIFVNTQQLRGIYVGNDLSCSNCHMGAGASPAAAPVWATVVDFPKYRGKNMHVNTVYERIAGCFSYSMNGTPPAPQSKVAVGIEAYMQWLATGAPAGAVQKARGYTYLPVPEVKPDYARGETIYAARCAVCHGDDGQGRKEGDHVVFPPLWGEHSFNWGAGMHDLEKAAGFIRHNMPLGNPDLTDAEVWDVALYMDSHQRPQDPRWLGNLEDTRRFFQRGTNTYGLQTPAGLMGDIGAPLEKPAGIAAGESSAPKPVAVAKDQIAAEAEKPAK